MKKKCLFILSLILLSYTGKSQGSNGLVAHWDFNGSADDVSGHGLDGTVIGASFAPGYTGNTVKALYFKGFDQLINTYDYVTIPYQSNLNVSGFSICALIKPTAFNPATCQDIKIFERGLEGNSDQYDLLMTDNAYDSSCSVYSPDHYVFTGGTSVNNLSPTVGYYPSNINLNNWYCVVLTLSSDTTRLYIDGALVKVSYRPGSNISFSTSGATIGGSYNGQQGGYPYPFTGYMDDIRVYSRPLNATEAGIYCDSAKMTPAAVANVTTQDQLITYPNPVTDKLNVQLPENCNAAGYNLQNAMGQSLVSGNINSQQNSISLKGYPTGIYLLKMEINGTVIVRKILKQ